MTARSGSTVSPPSGSGRVGPFGTGSLGVVSTGFGVCGLCAARSAVEDSIAAARAKQDSVRTVDDMVNFLGDSAVCGLE